MRVARSSSITFARGRQPRSPGRAGQDCASPEVAFHLAVYRGEDVLLWADDAGDGTILVAKSLPPETVERFRSALGASLRPYPRRHRLFGLGRARDE